MRPSPICSLPDRGVCADNNNDRPKVGPILDAFIDEQCEGGSSTR